MHDKKFIVRRKEPAGLRDTVTSAAILIAMTAWMDCIVNRPNVHIIIMHSFFLSLTAVANLDR